MHAVVRGIETCFQQVSQLLAVPKVLKTLFQDTFQLLFSNYICLNCVSQWLHGSQKFPCVPLSLYACLSERNCNLFQHQAS